MEKLGGEAARQPARESFRSSLHRMLYEGGWLVLFWRSENDFAIRVENLNASSSISGDLKLYPLFSLRIFKRNLCVLVLVLNRDPRPMLRSGFLDCGSERRWVQNLEPSIGFLPVFALELIEADRLCSRIVESDE
jgi:hypothetical protein